MISSPCGGETAGLSNSDVFSEKAVSCRFSWGLLVAIGCVVGCQGGSEGPARYALKGLVTYQGEPVPSGEILFTPQAGPGTLVTIEMGEFQTIPPEGGVVAGTHKVLITGRALSNGGALSSNEKLFRDYETTLTMTESPTDHNFEIPDGKK